MAKSNLPDTPEAKKWMRGAYLYLKENGNLKGYETFTLPDGRELKPRGIVSLENVDTENFKGLKTAFTENRTQEAIRRAETLAQQTPEGNTGFGGKVPKGMEDHHLFSRVAAQPFFEGLDELESKELARYAAEDLFRPLGNSEFNYLRVGTPEHKEIHRRLRDAIGLEKGKMFKLPPNATLDQRKAAFKVYVENVAPVFDEIAYDVMSKRPEVAKKLFHNMRVQRLRKTARLAAGAGVLGVGFLGTGASASETATRTQIASETGDIADKIQAGISGISLAADVATYNPLTAIPGTVVSTGADVINLGIDAFRQGMYNKRIRGRSGAQKAQQGT